MSVSYGHIELQDEIRRLWVAKSIRITWRRYLAEITMFTYRMALLIHIYCMYNELDQQHCPVEQKTAGRRTREAENGKCRPRERFVRPVFLQLGDTYYSNMQNGCVLPKRKRLLVTGLLLCSFAVGDSKSAASIGQFIQKTIA